MRLYITEPYPAVLFPSGHGKINISNDTVSFERNLLFGTKDGSREVLEWNQMFGPIRTQYYAFVWMKDLGFSPEWIVEDEVDTKLMPWKQRASHDLPELKDWYNHQLENEYDSIVFEKINVSVSMKSKEETNRLIRTKAYKIK